MAIENISSLSSSFELLMDDRLYFNTINKIMQFKENSQHNDQSLIENIFQGVLDNLNQFDDNSLESKQFCTICHHLGEIPITFKNAKTIQKLFDRAITILNQKLFVGYPTEIEQVKEKGKASIYNSIFNFPKNIYSLISDLVIDGDSDWKTIKYKLGLKAIIEAFNHQHGKFLEEIKNDIDKILEQNNKESLNEIQSNFQKKYGKILSTKRINIDKTLRSMYWQILSEVRIQINKAFKNFEDKSKIKREIESIFQKQKEKIFQKIVEEIDEENCTPLQKMTRELFVLLLSINHAGKNEIRAIYNQFIDKLRKIVESPIYNNENKKRNIGKIYDFSLDLVQETCWFRYTEVHIYKFCESVVLDMISKGKKEMKLVGEDDSIAVQIEAIHQAPQKYKAPLLALYKDRAIATLGPYYDAQKYSNMPHVWGDIEFKKDDGELQKVRLLRSSTPTHHLNAKILPEFNAFLDYMTYLDQKILISSLQQDEEANFSPEKIRSDATKELHKKYPNNVKVIVFSKDSDFYHQVNQFKNITNAKLFKNLFVLQMVTNHSGFHFPKEYLDDDRYCEGLLKVLEITHETMFDSKDNLTHQERCDFIEISYALINLYTIRYGGFDLALNACRDTYDRAVIMNAIESKISCILLGKEQDPDNQKKIKVLTHTPALLGGKREINGRKKRLIPVFNRLEDKERCEKIRYYNKFFGLTGDFNIKEIEGQSLDNI